MILKFFKKRRKKNNKLLINGFDEQSYLEANPDVKDAIEKGLFQSGVEHLEKFGLEEIRDGKRKFHPDFEPFSEEYYLNSFPDIKEAVEKGEFNSGFEHFCLHGYKEIINNTREWNNKIKEIEYIEKIIADSGLFDENFYLETYPDVKNYNITPIKHYIIYGWKEGKNPSKKFDTNYYLKINKDIAKYNLNPFYHYIMYGKKEGRLGKSPVSDYIEVKNVTQFFKEEKYIPNIDIDKPIEILIPVYNGYEYLEPLLKSIIRNTFVPFKILICDDKSTDERVYPFLEKFVNDNKNIDIVLIQNDANEGFVNTINKLVKYAENHFVILNTDTEVPPFWLERLMAPIFRDNSVASTTPFTNTGTICSFPNYLEDNPIFENLTIEEIDNYFQYVDDKNYIEIPTGVGFCMGVNKNVVDRIGMFDTVFGKGYGEENDFCQRAIKKGYRNLHIPNLFVYHKHGGSFLSEEKKQLINRNLKILLEKHPNYNNDVQKTIKEDKFKHLRDFIKIQILSNKYNTYLFLDHNLGGGTNYYLNNKINDLLQNGNTLIVLVKFDFHYEKGFLIDCMWKEEKFKYYAKNINELEYFLKFIKFNEIFVNSLVSFERLYKIIELLLLLKFINQAKLTIPVHDYFLICPNYVLLNPENEYCGLPSNLQECVNCLLKNKGEFKLFEKTVDIKKWRNNWRFFLENSDYIICFSKSSKEIIKKIYSTIENKIDIIPHKVKNKYISIYDESLKTKKKKVIGILGNINIPKGALIVKKLVKYIEKNNLNVKIVLIGEISEEINSSFFYKTGYYRRKELPFLVKKLGITEFLIPSICPETYSYTTDEIMQLGYPITVFNIGAPSERVKLYEKGNIISSLDEFLNKLRRENE